MMETLADARAEMQTLLDTAEASLVMFKEADTPISAALYAGRCDAYRRALRLLEGL